MTELRFDLVADALHAPRWATLHDPAGPAPADPARGILADHDRQALYRALRGNAHMLVHLRIRNGKIWVEADNTNAQIVQRLLDSGISKGEIVLAFYSPQKRPFTEFAVA